MSDLRSYLDNLWRWKCELPEEQPIILPGPEELRQTQMSHAFIRLMENRMIMGTFRYGKWQEQKGQPYDRVGSAIERLNKFKETGNKEYLVDSANMLMIEFEKSVHPLAHFRATDDEIHAVKTS